MKKRYDYVEPAGLTVPALPVDPEADKLVDGMLAKSRTKEWRPIEPAELTNEQLVVMLATSQEWNRNTAYAGFTWNELVDEVLRQNSNIRTLIAEVRRLRAELGELRNVHLRAAEADRDEARAALAEAVDLLRQNRTGDGPIDWAACADAFVAKHGGAK